MAEAVVHVPLVGVGEDRVGLGRFLELVFGGLVAGIAVGMELQRQLAVRALDLLIGRRTRRRPGSRSSRACSRGFGHLHHRRPQQPVAEHVAALQLLASLRLRGARAGLVDHRLVEVRIEVGAERLDGRDAALAQQVEHLLVDQLDALAKRVGLGRGRLQRALEVVDDRQQISARMSAFM